MSNLSNQPTILAPLIPMLSSVDFPVSITDKFHHYVFVNGAFERKYGHTLSTLRGKGSSALNVKMSDGFLDELRKGTRQGGWCGRLLNASRHGKRFHVGLRTMPLNINGEAEAFFLGVACDAGAEEMRDRVMLSLLMNQLFIRPTAQTGKGVEFAQHAETTQADFEKNLITHLSPKRREVYQLLSEGLRYKEIAYKLGVADATVRVTISALRKQLGETRVPILRRD